MSRDAALKALRRLDTSNPFDPMSRDIITVLSYLVSVTDKAEPVSPVGFTSAKRIDDLRETVELFMHNSAISAHVDAIEIKNKLNSMNDGETYHVVSDMHVFMVCYGRELNYWIAKGLYEV